jgi:hypothetical protein
MLMQSMETMTGAENQKYAREPTVHGRRSEEFHDQSSRRAMKFYSSVDIPGMKHFD